MFSKAFLKESFKIISLALPACLSQLGHIAVGVVDTLMSGQLGALPLASATLGLSVLIPFLMLSLGFSYGLTPLVAKADGENNDGKIASLLRNGMSLNIVFSLLLAIILFLCADFIYLLDQPPEILEDALPFLQILICSLVPLQIFQVYKQFAEGLSLTRQAMYISICANVLNIILNYLLIFGKFGFPELGLIGSALATLISRISMAAAMWGYIRFHHRFKKYREVMTMNGHYSLNRIIAIIKISFPIGLQLMFETGAFAFAALMAGWLGSHEIAAHQIALNLAAITYMVSTGISSAATIRVGNEAGSADHTGIIRSAYISYLLIIVFEVICTIIFITFRNKLPGLYIENEQIISLASSLLLVAAFFQMSDGIQVVGLGILRGLGDVSLPTTIAVISYWIIGLPCGYVLAFWFDRGVAGIWYGLLIGLTVSAAWLYYRFYIKIIRTHVTKVTG